MFFSPPPVDISASIRARSRELIIADSIRVYIRTIPDIIMNTKGGVGDLLLH